MASEWVPIPKDKALQVGDKIRLYYTTIGLTYITAAQIALVEEKLKGERRFHVIDHSYPTGGKFSHEFYFTIRITEPRPEEPAEIQEAGVITVAVCSTIILGALGVVVWISFAGARQLVEAIDESAEGVSALGLTAMQIAGALVVVYLVYKWT